MVGKYIFSFTLLYCAGCLISLAQSNRSILSKNDIIQYLPEISDGNAESFWNYVVAENKDFLSTMDKILNKNGSSAKAARKNIANALGKTEAYYANDAVLLTNIDSAKFDVLGHTSLADKIHVYYLPFNDVNAFCTPEINVYVYEGLLNSLPKDDIYLCFLGLLAHEFSHGLLYHALTHEYKTIKKEKQNNLVAGIASGLAIAHDSYSKARGTESMIPDTEEYISKVYSWANKETLLYQYKYSREMEYQADIVAFRFLDWIGVGGEKYIKLLQSIKQPFENSDEYSDHASTDERITLLQYLSTQKRIVFYQ